MAPGDHTAMLGNSLPNFVYVKDASPDLCPEAKFDTCSGCVMFFPSPTVKGPFMKDNVFYEVRQLSELQRIKREWDENHSRPAQLELRNDAPEEDVFEEMSEVIEQRQKFYIIVPVAGYRREDILIKAVGNNEIIIESKPKALQDEQSCLHMMFTLPHAVRLCAVKSFISSDGILVITAPKLKRKL